MYSPKMAVPRSGLILLGLGLIGAFALRPGIVRIGDVNFDIHTFTVACVAS